MLTTDCRAPFCCDVVSFPKKNATQAILKSEGDILSTEQTNGLFNLGDDLAPQEGDSKWVYTVPSDGIYKFNLNFVMGCCGGSRLARGTNTVPFLFVWVFFGGGLWRCGCAH